MRGNRTHNLAALNTAHPVGYISFFNDIRSFLYHNLPNDRNGDKSEDQSVSTIVHLIRSAAKNRSSPTPELSAYTSFVAHNSTIRLSSPTRLTVGRKRLDQQVFRNYPDWFLRAATPNRLYASISLDSFHIPFIRSARTRACNDASQFFILNMPMNYGQACRGLHYFPTALPFISAPASLAVLRQRLPLPDHPKHSSALIVTGGFLCVSNDMQRYILFY